MSNLASPSCPCVLPPPGAAALASVLLLGLIGCSRASPRPEATGPSLDAAARVPAPAAPAADGSLTPAPPARSACQSGTGHPGDTSVALGPAWNRFHADLEASGLHEVDFGTRARYGTRQAEAIRRLLVTASGRSRERAAALATLILGLRARTVKQAGSRWDCTTRMFQITAQARRLAGIPAISYTGWSTHTRRSETLEGASVYEGEHVSDAVLSLMAVGHYQDPRLGERNLAWKSDWLAPGAVLEPSHYDRLATGDVFFYPDYGPGHFGVVLLRERSSLLVVEGYWKGQATLIHVYPRADLHGQETCVAASLRQLRGFADLVAEQDGRVTWAKNVVPAAMKDKGRLRVATHR